ncbi:Flagellin [Shimia sp. SK013]|uniref:flagellin n=1 Tax=Shimia sp. SK013 TaxID=1389006 RepID=UPI0006B5DB8F|nr:flagellin [Shimia sp. SK013]KPA20322.1 Flagellin [Shimia sp. SK013]
MSSILTNNSAMVALQTLKSVNSNLADTQSQISTGKKVADAKDNAAVWAISKTMESDVQGFKTISESLSLGESTVSVARQASETVTDLLTQMKDKIVSAQGDNVDTAKIQTDITALKDQIESVVGAAQFNGLNLVDGSGGTSILASLDRDSTGAVNANSITIAGQDLSTGGYTAAAVFGAGTDGVAADSGDSFGFSMDATGGTSDGGTIEFDATVLAAGDSIELQIGDRTMTYTASAEDLAATNPNEVIAIKVKDMIEQSGADVTVDYATANPGELAITNADPANAVSISGQFSNAGAGGLGALDGIDVTTGAAAALGTIDGLIDTAIDAASAFGSAQSRLEIQSDYISTLSDAMTSGIGGMVDANMEETSARLQALQVQQQLATQSLSMANSAPQSILSLFG